MARSHDISIPYGGDLQKALARVTATALVMPGMTDRKIPGYLTRELYRGLKNAIWGDLVESLAR